jgi:hypothetical protein
MIVVDQTSTGGNHPKQVYRFQDHLVLETLLHFRIILGLEYARRALDLMGALKLGVHIGLDEIRADEFCAMLIIAEERDLLEREKLPQGRGG